MNEELKVIITAEIAELKQKVDEAKKQLEGLEKKGEESSSKFGGAMGAMGKAAGVIGVVVGAVAAVGGALGGLAESTREYRTEQAKLSAAFQTAGASAGLAKTTYNDLYRVLGDSGQATEAAQHLAKLTTNEKDLAEWTNICQGVYATFGDSLPIESLTEAVNHSAKLGEVQGSLADALEWSGVNVDEFNDALFLCNSESERERLIRETLNGKYAIAAENYEETAGAIMDANDAQTALNDAMAAMGEAVEPLTTMLQAGFAGIMEDFAPSIQELSQGIQDMVNGVEGADEKVQSALTGIVTTLTDTITDLVGDVIKSLPEIILILIGTIIDSVPDVLDAFVRLLGSIVEAIGIAIPLLLEKLPELITSLIDSVVNSRGNLMDGGVKLFNGIIDAIIKIIPSIIKNLPKIIDSIINGIANAAPQLLQSTMDMFGGLLDGIRQVPSKLKSGLANIVSTVKTQLVGKLKAALKFDWNLPKLKLPKISVAWKDSPAWMAEAAKFLGLKGVPSFSVNWNAMGGVFDKPTAFAYGNSLQGIGENGAEAVVPLENNLGWLDKLAGMISTRMGSGTPVVLQVDGKTLAKTTIGAINDLTRQQGKLSLNLL